MNTFRLFTTLFKQTLKKPLLLGILFLIPVCGLFFSHLHTEDESAGLQVGYILQGHSDDEADALLTPTVFSDYQGFFSFIPYEEEALLKEDILKEHLIAGLIIPADLFSRMLKGERDDMITLINSPRNNYVTLLTETVFSLLFTEFTKEGLYQFLDERSSVKDLVPEVYSRRQIRDLCEQYQTEGYTFAFEYENVPASYTIGHEDHSQIPEPGEEATVDTTPLLPLRGLLSVLILLAAFTGGVRSYASLEDPVFAIFRVRVINILIPLILSTLAALLTIFCFPSAVSLEPMILGGLTLSAAVAEILRLLLYDILVLLFVLLATLLIPGRDLYCAFFPIYLMGCLIFTPVFIDLRVFVPAIRTISCFFLPGYYI